MFQLTLALMLGYTISTGSGAGVPAPSGVKQAAPPAQAVPSARLVITRDTEIRLDGRLCSYEQVPASAVIIFAEVDSDRQTLLRIHYRSAQ